MRGWDIPSLRSLRWSQRAHPGEDRSGRPRPLERGHTETQRAKAQTVGAGGSSGKNVTQAERERPLVSQRAHGHFGQTDTQTAGAVKTLTPGLTDGSGR